MILFHAFTTLHLIEFIIYKVRYRKDDYSVILYPQALYNKYPQIENCPFFDEKYQIYSSTRSGIPTITNLRTLQENIGSIDRFEEIYIAGAQNAFAFWLIEAHKNFIFVEEAVGRLSRPEVIMKNDYDIDKNRYSLALKYGMYTGKNDFVERIICDLEAQVEGFVEEKAENFVLSDELIALDDKTKTDLLKFFNVSKFEGDKGVLILTQHFANLKMMSYEEQLRIYQSFIGFYFPKEGNIYVKLHPDDIANYKRVLPEIHLIEEKFPSELLLLTVPNPRDWTIATISSTGLKSLSHKFGYSVFLGTNYEREYIFNSVYYAVLDLLKNSGQKRIVVSSSKKEQIHCMHLTKELNIEVIGYEKDLLLDNSIYIFDQEDVTDSVEINKIITANGVCVFLGSSVNLCEIFKEKEIVAKTIAKRIRYKENNRIYETYIYIVDSDEKRRRIMMDAKILYEDERYDISVYSGQTTLNDNNSLILEGQLCSAYRLIRKLKEENTRLMGMINNKEKSFEDKECVE